MSLAALAAPDERAPRNATAGAPGGTAAALPADSLGGPVAARTADPAPADGIAARTADPAPADGVAARTADPAPADGIAARAIDVRLTDDGIIEVLLPPNQEIEGPEAHVAGGAVRSLAAGRLMPLLLRINGVVGVSAEARQVYSRSVAAAAIAVVGESPVDRVIAHYLLRAGSERMPAQFFSSEAMALDWLRQYAHAK